MTPHEKKPAKKSSRSTAKRAPATKRARKRAAAADGVTGTTIHGNAIDAPEGMTSARTQGDGFRNVER